MEEVLAADLKLLDGDTGRRSVEVETKAHMQHGMNTTKIYKVIGREVSRKSDQASN